MPKEGWVCPCKDLKVCFLVTCTSIVMYRRPTSFQAFTVPEMTTWVSLVNKNVDGTFIYNLGVCKLGLLISKSHGTINV